MRIFLAICLLFLTSICEGTSKDGQTVYVDKDGWVIGANQSISKTNNAFKSQKKDSRFFAETSTSSSEFKLSSKKITG